MASTNLQCCCGRPDCAYLHHNSLALSSLEADVETAARLGQALLDRHESYMAESEAERRSMSLTIDKLSEEKRTLEAENARMIEENRELLDQLEGLNSAISESDAHVKSLTATLVEAQIELRRLTSLASRTVDLEAQLVELELGQARLQQELAVNQESHTSAVSRWRQAELTISSLHDQIERIEKEAREERERHVELMAQMEKRRLVDSELKGAAGRLKGAAAVSTLGRNGTGSGTGTNVVSHFVRDILQDNANLQAGIVELREMLQISNEEVQNLRQQVLLHHPLDGDILGNTENLDTELELANRRYSQEVHVHHHYHTPAKRAVVRKDKLPFNNRGRKPRGSITPLATGRIPETPPSNSTFSSSPSTSMITPPPPRSASHRWSVQSSATGLSIAAMSTVSTSPTSAYRSSSIFDRMDDEYDSSRPTSPESLGFPSPRFNNKGHRKELSEFSILSFGTAPSRLIEVETSSNPEDPVENSQIETTPQSATLEAKIDEAAENLESTDNYCNNAVIPEESESDPATVSSVPSPDSDPASEPSGFMSLPRLRRSASHESLLSISGMDIHTLKERPAQMYFGSRSVSANSLTNPLVPPSLTSSTGPMTSNVEAHASSTYLSSIHQDLSSSQKLLSGLAASRQTPPSQAALERAGGLSKLVGNWSWGKWGVAPVPTPVTTPIKKRHGSSNSISNMPRMPGINQKGPILGFRPPPPAPSSVHAIHIDENLLQESLTEE